MIWRVRFQNFKLLRDLAIDLQPLTVFVGANGTGKSSVFEGIANAVFAARCHLGKSKSELKSELKSHPVVGFTESITQGCQGKLQIDLDTALGHFAVTFMPGDTDKKPDLAAKLAEWRHCSFAPDDRKQLASCLETVGSVRLCNLSFRALAAPSYQSTIPPEIDENGKGLASTLAYMHLNDPDQFAHLVEEVREVIPSLQRVRFDKTHVKRVFAERVRVGKSSTVMQRSRQYLGDTLLLDFDNAKGVFAASASEGTLFVLGLLTAIHRAGTPAVLMLDDLDHGLHPKAQQALAKLLFTLVERFPGLQILASTHSPYLLDSVEPDNVRLLAVGQDGFALCGKLSEHEDFAQWKKEMMPGEFWSVVGETWLAHRAQ